MNKEDRDLPNPTPRPRLTDAEYNQHRWKLFYSLFIFSVVYGFIHKILIPIFLSQTSVLITEYTEIDLWALPGIILAIYLIYKNSLYQFGSLMAGLLVCYAAWDARAVLQGDYVGWLAWSHALSSIPQGLMALVLLTFSQRPRSLRWAWVGSLLAVLFFSVESIYFSKAPHLLSQNNSGHKLVVENNIPAIPHLQNLNDCGVASFQVEGVKLNLSSQISLTHCGLKPAALIWDSKSLVDLNITNGKSQNLRIMYFNKSGTQVRRKNRIFRPHETRVSLSDFKFHDQEVAALIFSDTNPSLGKVLVLNSTFEFKDKFTFYVTEDRKLIWRKNNEF